MKTTPVSFLVAGMLLPVACLAQAQNPPTDPPKGEQREPGGPGRPFLEAWKLADADHDGSISKEEFVAMPRVQKLPEEKRDEIFKRLDKDSDGKLGGGELGHFGKNPHEGQRDQAMKRLWELDSDKSGGISFEEFKGGRFFMKLLPEKQQAVFQRLDTDGDGGITPKDRPAPQTKGPDGKPRPNKLDGKRPDGEGKPNFINRKLDVNGDGALSFEEFRECSGVKSLSEDVQEAWFERLDRNGDLKISAEDFPASPKPPKP
jgi:Ca2+-binding EF-hand superfamily protein